MSFSNHRNASSDFRFRSAQSDTSLHCKAWD